MNNNNIGKNIIETIIIVFTFILNPFFSVLVSLLFALHKRSSYYNLVLIINLSLFIGLLNSTKIPEKDLLAYYEIYMDVPMYSLSGYLALLDREFIYYLVSYIFYFLTNGSWKLFIILVTFISYFLILKSNYIIVKKLKTTNIKICFIILNVAFFFPLFTHSAHLLRNFIAGAFILYFLTNYYFLNINKWWILLIAIFIHSSALLFSIIYLLKSKYSYKRKIIFIIPMLILFFLVGDLSYIQSTYQFGRINDFLIQENQFMLSDLVYPLVFISFGLLTFIVLKNTYKNSEILYSIKKYLILLFVLVLISGFSLVFTNLLVQRVLLYVFILSTIYISLFVSVKNKFSSIISPILTTIIFFTFIDNYNTGVWEYASIYELLTNPIYSYFY